MRIQNENKKKEEKEMNVLTFGVAGGILCNFFGDSFIDKSQKTSTLVKPNFIHIVLLQIAISYTHEGDKIYCT